MKTKHRRRRSKSRRQKDFVPRTAKQFFAMPERFQERYTLANHVIAEVRARRVSVRKASEQFGIDPRVVIRLCGSALHKQPNGRYVAKPSDRLLRVLAVPTMDGIREVALRDSRQSSRLGQYWAAVQRYLQTGDDSTLRTFAGQSIKAVGGQEVELITNLDDLDHLGSAGAFSFESLYARSA